MNLALHGFLLQVILSILNFKHGFRLCSAGEPGYLDFDNLPETNFSCQGKVIGGYYADVEAGCQMFHVCTIGQKDEIMDIKFLCLNGTVFDQETRVCERVDEVDCSKSERFYNLNLELYGNNAVTLSLHEEDDDDNSPESRDDHQQQQQTQKQQHLMTSTRPSTTSSTSTTTSRSSQPSTTLGNNVYQHPTGYPQHYQPQPAFPSIQTSQSNTHYNDKNGGYHHQYIFHTDERNNNNQATSYQLFSNQGVSSTMTTPPVHQQIRYSSTVSPQVIHNESPTVMSIQYHVQSTSATIETLLNNNANNPSLINPLFHSHGITSTTEQYNIHNNNPREITTYHDNSSDDDEAEHDDRRVLEAVQSSNKGKVSKLTISPVPQEDGHSSVIQTKSVQTPQQQRISINYLPTPSSIQTTISDFYLTQNPTSQKSQNSQINQQIPQHIHVPPSPSIPQLKPHQITINLPPPDIQRIVQNPSPLLPSQSRVIVTAKASVSDESGRPLNASQLITLPLPTIPSNYDDYKEGDESFDPFYRDVPKIRNDRRIILASKHNTNKRHLRQKRAASDDKNDENYPSGEVIFNAEIKNIKDLKENLPIIKAILFGLPIPKIEESSKTGVTNIDNTQNNQLNESLIFNDETTEKITNEKNINNTYKIITEDIIVNISNNEKNEKIKSNTNDELKTITEKVNDKQISTDSTLGNNIEREIPVNPLIINHNNIILEPETILQFFSQTNEGNNSQLVNYNSSIPIELLKPLDKTIDISNSTGKMLPEVLQTQSFPMESNRRKYLNNESSEKFDEYLPRRNSYNNKPKSTRYYEEYDIDERIGLNLRPRSHRSRQRPKDRRRTNYRRDYLDEEYNEYNEYPEGNINSHNNNNRPRAHPRGSRVLYRNRNRNIDYEDELQEYEKLKLTPKALNSTIQITENSHNERSYESRKQRPDIEIRSNRGRPSLISTEQIQIKELDSELKQIDSPVRLNQENKNIRYSLNNKQNDNNYPLMKIHSNSSRTDNKSAEIQKDKVNEDYISKEELYLDEYNESEEVDVPDDYVDYTDFIDTIRETVIDNRRNRNRHSFDNEFEEIPQRKSDRQNKSRKFIEEKQTYEDRINNKYIELTSPRYELKDKMTNSVIANKVSSEANAFKEYDDYDAIKIVSTTENIKNSELFVQEKSSTEGIFKFTDELPLVEKNEEAQKNYKEKYEISTNEEDYVDDNYEPESYIYPLIRESSPSLHKFDEEYNKHVFIVNDQPTNIQISNKNKTVNNSEIRVDSKIDETYEHEFENTTASLISEEYYDVEITTNNFHDTTSNPISTSTRESILSSANKSTMNALIPITTNPPIPISTVTTTNMPKLATIPITANTTSQTTINYAMITPITSTLTPTMMTTFTSMRDPTLTDAMSSIHGITLAASKAETTTRSPILAMITTLTTKKTKVTTKFFKPITYRKNYTYTPPSTTPNSVVIRRGHPLSGPKPTKSPPTYNDLAPKPIIRRLPLLSRTTTSTSEPTVFEEEMVELPKYTLEQKDKNINENKISIYINKNISSVPETIKNHSISDSLPLTQSKKIEISNKDFDSKIVNLNETFISKNFTLLTKYNESIFNRDSTFNNEVAKLNSELNYSNKLTKIATDLVTETERTKSKLSLTNSNQNTLKLDSTTKNIDSTTRFKTFDIQTTTLRNMKPSERRKFELTSEKIQMQKGNQSPKPAAGFNCLEKEMYRFYGDVRDCRLFHYCSPGFTARQVLDFRFVCEEGTTFDEESQSCRHDVPNAKCVKRIW